VVAVAEEVEVATEMTAPWKQIVQALYVLVVAAAVVVAVKLKMI
jgi:hypothetical protein